MPQPPIGWTAGVAYPSYSTTYAKFSNTPDKFTSAAGPQGGDNTTLIAMVFCESIDLLDKLVWSFYSGNFGAGTGWLINVASGNDLFFLCFPGGAIDTGIILNPGWHRIGITRNGTGTTIFAVDGYTQAIASLAYTAPGGGSVCTIGQNQTNNTAGPGISQLVALNRAASAAEMKAWTAGSEDNRYDFPVSLTADPSVVEWAKIPRDYPVQGQATMTTLGSVPNVYTTVGTPLVIPKSEQVVPISALTVLDSVENVPIAPGVTQKNCMAVVPFGTPDTLFGLDLYATNQVNTAYDQVGVSVSGVAQTVALARCQNVRTAVNVSVPAGGSVTAVEGPQGAPLGTIVGTFVANIRTSVGGLSVTPAPAAPSKRLVALGDSITSGANATVPNQLGWFPLLRTNLAAIARCSGEMVGFRGIASYTTIDLVNLTISLGDQSALGADVVPWMVFQTNDYGLALCSAVQYGILLGAWLDGIHATRPTWRMFCQSAFSRIAPASEADLGFGSLPAYRASGQAAVVARAAWAVPPVYVDGTALGGLVAGDYDADGIHLINSGHAKLPAPIRALIGW